VAARVALKEHQNFTKGESGEASRSASGRAKGDQSLSKDL